MGARILVGHEQGSDAEIACFFDSSTSWSFGPVFAGIEDHDTLSEAKDEAEAFLAFLNDAHGPYWRLWDDSKLEAAYGSWAADNGAPATTGLLDAIEDATGEGRR